MSDIKPEELLNFSFQPPKTSWMDTPTVFKNGTWSFPGKAAKLEHLGLPNPRQWSPADEDWKLPDNFQEILLDGLRDRIGKYRSLQIFMDTCVRCGACADKCHFYIGGGDPKNMPVLRAELLRSVYRKDYTLAGKLLGKFAGARELTYSVVKEWFYYFFQCTECRRCSVFCPYGIDTAEITMIGRELLNLIGCNINWILEPVSNCFRTGNHLGIQPHTMADNLEFILDDIEDITGNKLDVPINKKGAEILFVFPSADVFADPAIYTFMGYMILFNHIGLDFTISTYASDGGNFGLFQSREMFKRLNAKVYTEAKRLGVKWILGGECGHMWRGMHQLMDTVNGPADFLEQPVSPFTGTEFTNAASSKIVHITEFTADLIKHDKLKFDKSRNSDRVVTFHDSCNPARAMGLLDEPRYIINKVVDEFYEMPENTIRESTFCCAGGAGIGNEENLEMRLRGGLPRGNACAHVKEKHGVNTLCCICAIDKATLIPLVDYWVPGSLDIAGVHELVGNALITDDRPRTVNLRNEPLPGMEAETEGGDDV
jgi:Fe-S oxidoreductase